MSTSAIDSLSGRPAPAGDALLKGIADELRRGAGAVQPQGEVLNATGQVAARFPGNMQY